MSVQNKVVYLHQSSKEKQQFKTAADSLNTGHKTMKTTAQLHASVLISNGINLEKDFYELTNDELRIVEKVRKAFKFSGRNNLGRSACRQFYYHCQKASK